MAGKVVAESLEVNARVLLADLSPSAKKPRVGTWMGNRGRTHVRHGESLASTIDLAFRIIQQDPADPLAENRPPEILELFREWWKLRTQSRNA